MTLNALEAIVDINSFLSHLLVTQSGVHGVQ
jgi:hypothetical protein